MKYIGIPAKAQKYQNDIPTIFRTYHTRLWDEKTAGFVLTKRAPKRKIRAYWETETARRCFSKPMSPD